MRRATALRQLQSALCRNFYPRSPCGERPRTPTTVVTLICISIHALLAESDQIENTLSKVINHFYPRSPCGERLKPPVKTHRQEHFYPRSPCGERLTYQRQIDQKSNFYPRSPCGERLYLVRGQRPSWGISIHALLAESDICVFWTALSRPLFLSTLSLRRATPALHHIFELFAFLSTLSLRRATVSH